jgi:NADH-quinone oxidoreductase subunit H
VADAIKLLLKEAITTRNSDKIVFWLAPIIIFVPTLVIFAVIPFNANMVLADLNVGVLFLIAIASTNTLASFLPAGPRTTYSADGLDANGRHAHQL